ncbi:D-alanyl-D-alanine carboxypeptidase family protein [Planococcus lenghuensis]|uniref:serine-type D-Ala-D-Ala carboxypeptidase n=1 Tax=Planococcus lenghuensis TaxID=2213202 RepID=A0A1Q2KU82_9BACL|nr:D-alanyl-D-alanine carboxypeptidase family protein [Planococcus lenghuensis]AQQ51686.1 D-alanyl-D-alanine carboxypeptidase [Planococcus lenghuensis]
MIAALVVIMLLSLVPPGTARAEAPILYADAAILVDADTGRILYAHNADESLGVASMTKMMTEYLLLQAIAEGRVSWDQEYEVTDFVHALSIAPGLANVPLRRGETYSVKELYEAMAIYSANAATVGLTEILAGSEGEFVKMMNATAEELGLEGTEFVNSTGLGNSDMLGHPPAGTDPDGENVMTARSVAKLSKRLLEDYPEVLETARLPYKTFRKGTSEEILMRNWNFMLEGLTLEYEGMDGLKTGTTNFAGYCFTGTAKRDGRRLIAVVMNTTNESGGGSHVTRFHAARQLLDYGFEEFSVEEIVPAGYQFPAHETLIVEKGKQQQVGIAAAEPLHLLIETADRALYRPELILKNSVAKNEMLEAPVKEGQQIGIIKVERIMGTDYGFLDSQSAATGVVTTEAVERAGRFALALESSIDFMSAARLNVAEFVQELF